MSVAFETFGMFLALQRHFTSETYDYFKYAGKVKTNYDKFLQRHDKYHFHRLSKREDPNGLVLANLLEKPKCWVTDVLDADGEKVYRAWKKRTDSLSYFFKDDLSRLEGKFDDLLIVQDGKYPKLLKYYQHGSISLETLVIIDEATGVFKHWNKKIEDQLIWPDLYMKLSKYRPFLPLREVKPKLIQIIVDNFQSV